MICPNCKRLMKITHTYLATASGKTQRLECEHCLTTATAVVVFAIVEVNPERGRGAKALAKCKTFGEMIKNTVKTIS